MFKKRKIRGRRLKDKSRKKYRERRLFGRRRGRENRRRRLRGWLDKSSRRLRRSKLRCQLPSHDETDYYTSPDI